MAKRKPKKGGDIPEWVVTYGDLMSLLLCFFILLVAFSEPKKPREFQKVLEKIKEALGANGGLGLARAPESPNNSMINELKEIVDHGGQAQFMERNNQDNVIGPKPDVSVVHDGNFHAIGGSLTFAAGRVDLSLDVKQVLRDEVAPKIRDRNNIVRIVGHTWGFQDSTAGDHLAVSFERTRAVFDYLVDTCGIDPAILRLVAAGDSEPSSGGSGDASENRRVQVYMTDRTIDQVHPDPFGTGRGRD